MPLTGHPLTPTRRQATVVDVGTSLGVGIVVGGDDPADTSKWVYASYLDSYTPVVGDTVITLEHDGDYFVIGRPSWVAGPPKPNMQVQDFTYSDFSSGTRTFLEAAGAAIPIPPSAADGAHSISVQLMHHCAIVTVASTFALDLSTADAGWTDTAGRMGSVFPQIAVNATTGAVIEVGDITIVGTWTIPAGATTFTPRLNAQRISGTGALRSAGGYSIWQWWIS